ncbi:class I adenylate cyclase [Shewanella inventionis]|uniref:Adenylate cyclase n=1 Tax=Shewanella inventionis TaxID=1738770 RepID=A0ABQ1JK37_9GAMM|nr:class I adenylate cyclase [Shewanella inventionis]MCL1159057.1 class I adenylate cyclase [Shewanella inventionis]GGB71020.1 adenylate cyclase [Shewanella inventionis]
MAIVTACNQQELAQQLNSIRIARVLSVLPPMQQQLLHLIPLMLQVNHADLPGALNEKTPCGIDFFSLTDEAIQACNAMSLGVPVEVQASSTAFEGVYAMGSSASFGQNPQSDIDVWLVYKNELTRKDLELISYKNKLLTEWFAGFDFEVNFYLVHPMQFREPSVLAHIQSLGVEHSGSSQHWLLLEEFYRSHIRLAGKTVAWWPSANQDITRQYPHLLYLGDVTSLPAAEYFGASLWQLYKGLNKPHKALLKVLLLETYAFEYPDTTLITQQIWQMCEQQNFSCDNDAYLLLYYRIERYLLAQNDNSRLEIVRRCFYLKSGVMLSQWSLQNELDWRGNKMQQLVDQWNWSPELIATLDNSIYWHSGQLKWFNQQLSELLLTSYKNLLQFASTQALSDRMRVEELGLLARKLHTYFSDDDHILQPLNRLWSLSTQEAQLTVRYCNVASRFYLYRQKQPEGAQVETQTSELAGVNTTQVIHEADNVCSLVAWAVMNGLATADTKWSQVGRGSRRADKLGYLSRKLIPVLHNVPVVLKRHLSEPWFYQKIVFVVNVDDDPTVNWQGQELMFDYIDLNVLSFGRDKTNLLSSIAVVCLNSWGEWQSHRFSGDTALLEAISFIILGLKRSDEKLDLSIISCSAKLKQPIFNQLKALLLRCYGLMKKVNQTNTLMHQITVGEYRYGMYFNSLGMMYRKIDTTVKKDLVENLVLARPELIDDPYASVPSVIQQFVATGAKQYFLRERNDILDVFIVDENNQLTQQQYQDVSMKDFVGKESHLYVFNQRQQRLPVFNMPQFFQLSRIEGELQVIPFGLSDDEMGTAF